MSLGACKIFIPGGLLNTRVHMPSQFVILILRYC